MFEPCSIDACVVAWHYDKQCSLVELNYNGKSERKMMMEKGTGTVAERIQKFVDEIDTIWADWNKPPKQYAINQQVKFDFGKRRGGMDEGEVVKVRGTNVEVRWKRNGLARMAADMLDEYN